MMSPATAKSRRLVIDPKVCRRSQWHNGSHVTVAVVLPHSQHEGGNSDGLRSDAVTGYALRAHTQGTGGTKATPIVKLMRPAIRSWRDVAGLDNQSDANSTSVDSARQLMGVLAHTV
jgi:hypothetical protein